jgi:hypothetical protein
MARPRKNVDAVEVLRLRVAGYSLREIASEMRLGRGTVHRAIKSTLGHAMLSQNPKSRHSLAVERATPATDRMCASHETYGNSSASQRLLTKPEPASRTITVYSVFGDESHEGKADVIYVVSGLFGDNDDWEAAKSAWLEITKGEDFHANEWSSRPEYIRLCRVLRDSKLILFACGMDLTDYESVFPNPVDQLPYYYCFSRVVEHFAEIASQCLEQDKVKFTFDRNLDVRFNATYLYDCMIKLPEFEHWELLADEVSFATRKDERIQMADLIARETMRHLATVVLRGNETRSSCLAELLDSRKLHWHHYDKGYFVQRAAGMHKLVNEGHPMGGFEQWRQYHNCQDTTENRTRFHVEVDKKLRKSGISPL